ncbi:MAG: AEC family transporter [Chloroflexi bacterium]|nr:AEC family transporter [Chloroflexota bacterium]
MDLASLGSILVNIISPIVLVAAAGFVLAKKIGLEARPLSRTTLYLFTPALVFSSIYKANLSVEYVSIAVFSIIITFVMVMVAWLLAKILHYDRLTTSAFMLGILFVNAGNYGLPLILFAFGDEGLARAAFYFAMSAILTQTLGIFVAASGRANPRDALLKVFKLPLVYGVLIGLIFNLGHIVIPEFLMKAVTLAKDGAVPAMLVILGIELARVTVDRDHHSVIGIATIAKLMLVPLLSFPLAALMGMTGVTRAVCIVESSMPTAVMASIVAVEFDARPKIVTGIIFASTLASIITLTILLGILK